jgi:hypothetical protein
VIELILKNQSAQNVQLDIVIFSFYLKILVLDNNLMKCKCDLPPPPVKAPASSAGATGTGG